MNNVSTDVKSLSETVRERIGTKVVEFLPDEVFDNLLEAAVRDLVTAPPNSNYHDTPKRPPLQQMIYDQITDQMNARIKAELSKDEWQTKFNANTQQHVSSGVESYIKKHAVEIMTQLLQRGVAEEISAAIHRAQNTY